MFGVLRAYAIQHPALAELSAADPQSPSRSFWNAVQHGERAHLVGAVEEGQQVALLHGFQNATPLLHGGVHARGVAERPPECTQFQSK